MSKLAKRSLRLFGWLGVMAAAAVLASRFPLFIAFAVWPSIAAYLALLARRYKNDRVLPKFSLRALLMLVGLVACCLTFAKQKDPWRKVHAFPGYSPNIAMSPDGSLVAVSEGPSIEIRETRTGRHLSTLEMPPVEAAASQWGPRWQYDFAFSEDNATLLIAGWRPDVHLYDWKAGVSIRSWPAKLSAKICRSGRRFTTVQSDGTKAVWETGGEAPLLTFSKGPVTLPHRPKLSDDGGYAATITWDNALEVWHIDSQTKCFEIAGVSADYLGVTAIFSPDEKLIAVPTKTGVEIWDIQRAEKRGAWQPPGFDHTRTMTWSPDAKRLLATYSERIGPSTPIVAAATNTPNVIHHSFLLDDTGKEIAKVVGSSAAFSPKGDRIATVYGPCRILDGRTGKLLLAMQDSRPTATFQGFESFAFSPDGNWLLVSGDAAVYQKTRSEWWYSVLTLPSYWAVVVFAVLLIREAVNSGVTPSVNDAAE